MTTEDQEFSHLDRAGRLAGNIARQPRAAVYGVVALAVVLSWLVIAAMAVRGAEIRIGAAASPGDNLVADFFHVPLPAFAESFFALCLTPPAFGQSGTGPALVLTAMWFLMALAMMLPSAAPMIRTYCEIADTARGKAQAVVHPMVLVAGYLAVWLVAAIGFAAMTTLLHAYRGGGALDPMLGIAGASALILAGLYQFSGLKDACLKKCRNPFQILFARWSTRPASILRLGMDQGLWCLGCCWALMLVMFAVGVMNIFWMAVLALFTLVEKQTKGVLATRLAGAILLVWGTTLLLVSI